MNLIKRNGRLSIDKREIDGLIAAQKFIGLNRSPRAEKVIVSLTSYEPRINDVKYTIYSLLNQTFAPDKLILWLDEDSFPQREKNLPRDLLKLRSFGLTIDWCENLRSYKKLIPALEKFPDDIIVTADDDIYYRPDWLKALNDVHVKNPDCLVAHYTHRVKLDTQGNFYPYTRWYTFIDSPIPMLGNSSGTGGGALFKKSFLHSDVLRRDIFMELAPLADELWFWAMAILNGTKTKIPAEPMNRLIYNDIDLQEHGETLRSKNVDQGKNDVQLRQIIGRYPALLDKLIREAVDAKPYISVVVPVKNPANMQACMKNIFWQNFPDLELIVINHGARMNLPTLPTNFRVINYPDGAFTDGLNLGLRKAEGDYILFKGENFFLQTEALNIAAQTAADSKADVIHFAGRMRVSGNDGSLILDDKLSYKNNKPMFLDATKQQRAALWLQNKLSKRLDTKIFRRDFLTEHALTFDGDISEFMFQALTAAEKYLLVPRAFGFFKE